MRKCHLTFCLWIKRKTIFVSKNTSTFYFIFFVYFTYTWGRLELALIKQMIFFLQLWKMGGILKSRWQFKIHDSLLKVQLQFDLQIKINTFRRSNKLTILIRLPHSCKLDIQASHNKLIEFSKSFDCHITNLIVIISLQLVFRKCKHWFNDKAIVFCLNQMGSQWLTVIMLIDHLINA